MKILISGSTGTLGYGLTKYLLSIQKYHIFQSGFRKQSDFKIDFTDKNLLFKFLDKICPDLIINLVCLANVDECEKDLNKALIYNANILKNLSFWSIKNNCKIIHISTDQVYDSWNNYNNENDVNIKNNYAFSKLKGEEYLKNINSCILRTNFFGHSRSKKTLNEWFLNSINNNDNITLFNDIQFNPVLMDTLFECIDHIISNFKSGIYNFGSKYGLSKAEFCKKLMENLNIQYKNIKIVSVDQSDLIAYRPKGMMMNIEKFQDNFKFKIPKLTDEIRRYIKNYKLYHENKE